MNLKAWEATIQQIATEFNHEPNEGFKDNILLAWRAKLAKEPTALRAFQIDGIVREARSRIIVASR